MSTKSRPNTFIRFIGFSCNSKVKKHGTYIFRIPLWKVSSIKQIPANKKTITIIDEKYFQKNISSDCNIVFWEQFRKSQLRPYFSGYTFIRFFDFLLVDSTVYFVISQRGGGIPRNEYSNKECLQ